MFEVDSIMFRLIIISSHRDMKDHLKRNVPASMQRKLDYNLVKRGKPLLAGKIYLENQFSADFCPLSVSWHRKKMIRTISVCTALRIFSISSVACDS